MTVDNKKIAEDVLAAVGGASNVTNATHCMTRLRLNLKDQSIPNDNEVKKIKGVLGAQWSGGQYQVIIGQNVPKVYDAAIALGVKGEGSIDENLDDGTKEPLTVKTAGKKALNYLSKTMCMTIPIIMGAAMFRTLAVLCGDGMLGIWSADSDIYNFFYNWIYNAGYYFLPVYLGWAAAKQLGCSQPLGMMLGGVLAKVLTDRWCKLQVFFWTNIVLAVFSCAFYFFNPHATTLIMVLYFLLKILHQIPSQLQWSLMSDVDDYGEWKTGYRTEGLINSASSFGFKVGNGLGSAILGWVIGAAGASAGSEITFR